MPTTAPVMIAILAPILSSVVQPALVPVVGTLGDDPISRGEVVRMAAAHGIRVVWNKGKAQALGSVAYCSEGDATRLEDSVLKREDLNANVLGLHYFTQIDRFFSLPKESVTFDGPFAVVAVERFSTRARTLLRFAAKTRGYRRSASLHGSPERIALSIRPGGRAGKAIELFIQWGVGEAPVVARYQQLDGRCIECGTIDRFPRSYRQGLQSQNARGTLG